MCWEYVTSLDDEGEYSQGRRGEYMAHQVVWKTDKVTSMVWKCRRMNIPLKDISVRWPSEQ